MARMASLIVAALILTGLALWPAGARDGGIAVSALTTTNALGLVLIASAVAVFLAFAIIEPATARAAFGDEAQG